MQRLGRFVIVGFMGSGKTTVANALARRLKCQMLDLDSFISEREGRSPASIIDNDGEAAFRVIETEALREALQQTAARVIALGGGAWTIAENRGLVAQHECRTVWLDASFDLCWQRIAANWAATRPLAPNQATAHELYERRCASYELADLKIEISGDADAQQVVDQILTQAQTGD